MVDRIAAARAQLHSMETVEHFMATQRPDEATVANQKRDQVMSLVRDVFDEFGCSLDNELVQWVSIALLYAVNAYQAMLPEAPQELSMVAMIADINRRSLKALRDKGVI